MALAQSMVSGLTANAAIYPAPPVAPAALTTLVNAYTTAKNAAVAAQAAAEAATAGHFSFNHPRTLYQTQNASFFAAIQPYNIKSVLIL